MDINKVKAVELTQEEAVGALADKVKEFNKALSEAVELADNHGLEFDIYPTYGMGGYYEGKGFIEDWDDAEALEEGRWRASSQSC